MQNTSEQHTSIFGYAFQMEAERDKEQSENEREMKIKKKKKTNRENCTVIMKEKIICSNA